MSFQNLNAVIPEKGAQSLSTTIYTGPAYYLDAPHTNRTRQPVNLYSDVLRCVASDHLLNESHHDKNPLHASPHGFYHSTHF
jgi:hypothetical protein